MNPTRTDEDAYDEQPSEAFWTPPPTEPAPPKKPNRVLAVFLAALLGAGAGTAATYYALDSSLTGDRVVVRTAPPPITDTSDTNSAARVAQALLPSIVQIQTAGSFGGNGVGSGVIMSDDGYIITNNHVIADAQEITVNLPNGESLSAVLVGTAANAGQDIAVVKVAPTEPLPAVTFGSSKDILVGEQAIAIGSPFGLDATVTAGIISAVHRNPDGLSITDAIQTDAAINPGNSGGALANARGEVIGINTAIVGGSGNVGVGFAIPIDIARKVAEQIIETGHAQLAYLGIQGANLPGEEGARVNTVQSDTPAQKAGLRSGDVIVELDGDAVPSMDVLISLLIEKDVGDVVRLVVVRDDERITLTATLAARPS